MKLLITPALTLSESQKQALSDKHTLYFLQDERLPLCEQALSFSPEEIEGIVCNLFFMKNSPDVLPSLRFIQLTSAGLDRVPLEDIRARGIALFNAGATYARPMAEWAVTQILQIAKGTVPFHRCQQAHTWQKQRDIKELGGMTAAIVGFGHVGREVARRLRAFDVRVAAVDVVRDDSAPFDEYYDITALDEALSIADIAVLTLPLTAATHHILDARRLALMKRNAILVNVARGALIDEQALIAHLQDGGLLGAALDVFETEPLPADSPLWDMERVLVSPHNSFVGNGNADRLFALVKTNLDNIER